MEDFSHLFNWANPSLFTSYLDNGHIHTTDATTTRRVQIFGGIRVSVDWYISMKVSFLH